MSTYPFNLAAAKGYENSCFTRTGDKAKFLTDELNSGLVAFLVCGRIELYNKDGTYYDNAGGEHHLDLFMV